MQYIMDFFFIVPPERGSVATVCVEGVWFRLQVHFFEDGLRNATNDEHDEGPKSRHVDDIASFLNGAENSVGDNIRSSKERALGQVSGHGRGDESRTNGENLNSAAIDAITDTIEKNIESALRSAVDVITLTSPVPGDGRDNSESTGALRFKIVGKDGNEGDSGEEVGADHCFRSRVVRLGHLLIAEDAMGDEGELDVA